jgi:alpha-glucosidase
MNYYFIHKNSVDEIIQEYSSLTGRIELPPLWSLGLHQCRYSYYPDKEVVRIAQTYREKNIPCDAIWLDIHYMDQYKVFTFDKEKFPNPKQLSHQLKELGFKTVVIIDPGIKTEKGYEVYEDGIKNNVFVQYPDQSNYEAEVWPGWSCFPDFTNASVREWWGKWMKFYTENGIEGFWNDMNEPASWGQHTPDLLEFSYEGEKATHKKARNIYGMQMARATYESSKKQLKGNRTFVLTRAAYAGIQRYAALWTGDNVASDEHMMLGVRLVNSLGLSGVPFTGYDVGGFAGEASAELFARWISIGAFSPFFRCHSMINSKSAEPWSFGEKTYEIAQNYIQLRYRLLPYIYSAFYEASQTGIPITRSIVLYWPHDEKTYLHSYQHQYLFGPSILVAAVESNKEFVKVYLPEGKWYNFHTNKLYEGKQEIVVEASLEKLPLFIKAGSIVPMQSIIHSTNEKTDGVLSLYIYNGVGEYQYYEDDGVSYQYHNGEYYKRTFSLSQQKLELKPASGKYKTKFNKLKIYWQGEESIEKIKVNGKMVESKEEEVCFIKAISNFDPFSQNTTKKSIKKKYVELTFDKNEISIEWN